ncbi:hypothetical protein HAHE_35180 [Haloferula helveola]|uniref:Uncharacterized protein n=1 Tax=Haloferula helveola TaxID=490095 RepID=A0ABM7RQK3_9BACT|nr:hypothetical protein HAHE_35180 [Haloferula helveola]
MGPESLLLILPVAGCLGIFWIILKFSSSRIATQYRLLAERFGLELDQPPVKMGGFVRPDPSLHGEYRGREVSFSAPGKGLKGTRQIESLVKLELKDRRLRAQMAPAGLLGGLRQRDSGGKGRWKSGDEAFDEAVDVRTGNPAILQEVLTDERRKWLASALKKSKATLYIGDGAIAWAKLGLIADEATRLRFEEVVEFFCDFAEAVEG